ncbi:uncharacterized protein EAE97_009557 [Botrytis byssoidea]|uniref:Rhodopsin domain-containing protein n=1 Tax=Botrytis byssoidea TaxID=139641 RepID=A0A9P5IA24_9HELO|nr:uncharacterized protein EAE97_009557 [Botrytis byssoidea]KAF7929960.1 hypothetical protein EAE97_009557 [Botrytis byssoidea]
MANSTMEAPAGGDVDRGPTIMAIMWVQAAISCIVVALRFWARITIKALGKDDWIMLCTLINFLVFCGFVTVQALHGGDRHLYYIPPAEQEFAIKMTWLLQPFVILAICLGKVSVAFLIMRLLSPTPKWPKPFLWFCIISCLVFVFVDIVLTYVQCTPAKALWDPTVPHTCWEPKVQSDFAIFCATWLVFIDALLAISPIMFFGRLKMSMRKKIGICALLGGGIIAAICGSIKISYLTELSARADITWATYDLFVWSGAEAFILIVCGSIPPLKILWDRYISKKTGQTKTSSSSYIQFSSGRSRTTAHQYDGVTYDMKPLASPLPGREVDLEGQRTSTIQEHSDSLSIGDRERPHSVGMGR